VGIAGCMGRKRIFGAGRSVAACRVSGLATLLIVGLVLGTGRAEAQPASAVAAGAAAPKVTAFLGEIPGTSFTTGSDGAVWFVGGDSTDAIDRIDSSGHMTAYPTGTPSPGPIAITSGPGGDLWFTASRNSIEAMNTSGQVVKKFVTNGQDKPGDITAGADGDLWFTARNVPDGGSPTYAIGQMTPFGKFTYYAGAAIDDPTSIASGPDGDMWWTNDGSIGRMSASGEITEYSGSNIDPQGDITEGPDGAMWFTIPDGIGRITEEGQVSTFPFPASSLISGPEDDLWFTSNGMIESIDSAGQVTEYKSSQIQTPDSIASAAGGIWVDNLCCGPQVAELNVASGTFSYYSSSIGATTDIARGSDGALWYTMPQIDEIGRISTSGVTTLYSTGAVEYPQSIISGPGGLWFAGDKSIGRMTATGKVSAFSDPDIDFPENLTVGPDGAVWFTDQQGIGRITSTGQVTKYTGSGIGTPIAITSGPDGELWFSVAGSGTIGKLDPGTGTVTDYKVGKFRPVTSIVAGPDGALWFDGSADGAIGRITTAGRTHVYSVAGAIEPGALVNGPDGDLWFTTYLGLGRITTGGTAVVYSDLFSGISSQYHGNLAFVPGSGLWVSDPFTIYQVTGG
jgi:streptogramin lyase